MKTFQFHGMSIPAIGLGTWQAEPGQVEGMVETAVQEGYRHIDCAMNYGNQEEIGKALKKVIPSVVRREQLFITGKLWNTSHRPDLVEKELDETLRQLGLEYLDLYLMHFPVAFVPGKGMMPENGGVVELDLDTTVAETFTAMVQLLETGKVRAIGVSNFTTAHLRGLIEATGHVPSVSQVELHPLNPQNEHLQYCKKAGIHVTGYSPLGKNLKNKPLLTEHPVIKEIAKAHDVNEAQILVSWGVDRGYSVIVKSVKGERLAMNLDKVSLTAEDHVRVSNIAMGKEERYNVPYTFKPKWDIDIFDTPEEKNATHQVKIA